MTSSATDRGSGALQPLPLHGAPDNAGKLFDACHIAVGDNGRSLPQQYRSAIDMLTPKLNAKIAEAKNLLRRMLMTPYPTILAKASSPG
jgi:hypothetical protein